MISLNYVNVRQMSDLGLVSVLSPLTIAALILLMVSFCLALRQLRVPILLFHVALLIFMLYGVTTLVEEAPRFAVVYRHAGYTEYIMRTGTVDPGLDAYFNWPGFFILSAFLTRAAGYNTILSYAVWAPVFLNLIYLGPLYMIFTSATLDKRLVWLALWFFYLTNWIGQDYFSPQGFDFFMYLVIIAILLKWFRVPVPVPGAQHNHAGNVDTGLNGASPVQAETGKQQRKRLGRFSQLVHRLFAWLSLPDTLTRTSIQPQQRVALLVIIVIVFAFVVFSHPLTPFFILASVTALVVFRRCRLFWLPILMAVMTAVWILLMTQPFLVGHLDWVTGGLGHIFSAFSANVTDRVGGSPEHSFIEKIRLIMTLLVWGLALVGAVHRLHRGYRDLSYLLLAIAPFPLLVAQPYGGEMLLRIYLFTLPPMIFFAASIFYPAVTSGKSGWTAAAVAGISILLLAGFLFTRYGNERMDYMTNDEVAGIRYLYSIAQPHSVFIEAMDGAPWQLQDFEKYDTHSLTTEQYNAVASMDINAIVQFIRSTKRPHAYLIFTRSEEVSAEATTGLPPGALDRLEKTLLASGKFELIYSNPDAQILLFVG